MSKEEEEILKKKSFDPEDLKNNTKKNGNFNFSNKSTALSLEWRMKKRRNLKGKLKPSYGLESRIRNILLVNIFHSSLLYFLFNNSLISFFSI